LSASENYLLQAKDVTVRFGGLTAVDAVSMNIALGELVGIMGPNGAGKTTFFNAISGVTPLTSGQLKVDGRSLTGALQYR
jgi:branched-chain amino acid transport system ATP-binding protein